MDPEPGSRADRERGDPRVVDATLDELVAVFGADQVQQMFDAHTLTDAQGRAWQARATAGPTPAYGAPVPPGG